MILANYATDVTLGLIVVFGGIGVVVGGIVAYIAAQAMGERAENRRRGAGAGGEGETAA
ncbi:MAG: hypothetical protein ACJ76S_08820 [Solirubrobacteraceae bacterium]